MSQYDGPEGLEPRVSRVTDDDPDTAEIRVEIEQTRTEMSGTLEAIGQKLSPDVLAEQAKDAAREAAQHAVREVKDAARDMTTDAKDAAYDATIGRAEQAVEATGEMARGVSSTVIETIKQNPMPAMLAAASIGWLYMNRSTSSPQQLSYPSYGAGQAPYPRGTAYGYQGRPVRADVQGRSTVDQVTGKVSETAEQVGDTAGQLASSAGEMASDAADTAGELVSSAGQTAMGAGSTLLDTIRANPLPAALTGVGLTWLLMNRSSAPSAAGAGYPRYRPDGRSLNQARPYTDRSTVTETVDGVKDTAASVAGQAQRKAGDVVDTVQDTAGGLVDTVQETAGGLVDQAQYRTRQASGGVQRLVQENPLMAAGVSAALGAATGFYLSPTRGEDQLVGKLRDNVMGQAQEVTQDAMEKVQRVAGEAQDTVKKEAEREGLTT